MASMTTRPSGHLRLAVVNTEHTEKPARIINQPSGLGRPLSLDEIMKHGFPQRDLPDEVNDWRSDNSRFGLRDMRRRVHARHIATRFELPHLWSQLWLVRIDAAGNRLDLGLASLRVVTTAGVQFLVDAFQGLVEPELLRYHGIGTNNTAEAVGDTALGAELTTQYDPDNTRATGSQTEGSGANIFQTVATNSVDSAVDITEHGLFSQAATGGGVLWDRSVFSTVSLGATDGLQSTYDLTIAAGG